MESTVERRRRRREVPLHVKAFRWFKASYSPVMFLSFMFTFFFQLVYDLLRNIFSMALLDTSLNVNVLFILCFISPLLVGLVPRKWITNPRVPAVFAALSIGCRVAVPTLVVETGRAAVGCAGVALFLIFFTIFVHVKIEDADSGAFLDALVIARGIGFSVTYMILFHAIGASVDVTMSRSWGDWVVLGWIMCGFAFVMSIQLFFKGYEGGWVLRKEEIEEAVVVMQERIQEQGQVREEEEEEEEEEESNSSEEDTNRKRKREKKTLKKRRSLRSLKPKPIPVRRGGICNTGVTWKSLWSRTRRRLLKPLTLSVGVVAHVLLIVMVLASPTVVPRWSQTVMTVGTLMIQIVVSYVLVLSYAFLPEQVGQLHLNIRFHIGRIVATSFNLGSLMIAATIVSIGNPVQRGAVYIFLVTSPVILINLMLMLSELMLKAPTHGMLSIGFAVGGIGFLGVVLMEMAVTYFDTMPLASFFRDRYYAVVAIAAGVGAISLNQVSFNAQHEEAKRKKEEIERIALEMEEFGGRRLRLTPEQRNLQDKAERLRYHQHRIRAVTISLALVAIMSATCFAVAFQTGLIPDQTAHPTVLNLAGYNVHLGMNISGNEAFGEIGDVLEDLHKSDRGPLHIIGLQETDTNKLSTGNTDILLYLSMRLEMDYYAGPPSPLGTFGVGVLSSYELRGNTFHLLNRTAAPGRQVPVLQSSVKISGKAYNIFVVLFDSNAPLLPQALGLRQVIGNSTDIILFASTFTPYKDLPGFAYYETRTTESQLLIDAWHNIYAFEKDEQGKPGYTFYPKGEMERRADYIFVSPTMNSTQAQVLYDAVGPSNHAPLYARVKQLKEFDLDCDVVLHHPLC